MLAKWANAAAATGNRRQNRDSASANILNTLYRLRKDDCSRSVRGHALSLAHVRCNTAARQQFLTNRVVKVWNSLPESVIKDAVGSQT